MACVSEYPVDGRAWRRVSVAAFTLLEVLIVVAIIAVLFTLGLAVVRGARERAAISRTQAELALLAAALEEFQRVHGDYPHAPPPTSGAQHIADAAGPSLESAAAILFNALSGAIGPRGAQAGPANGPLLVELAKFVVERPVASEGPELSAGGARIATRNAFVDPWGNRYLYFYRANVAATWNGSGYVLLSAGPDGKVAALPSAQGVFAVGSQFAEENADNIYAGHLP